MTNQLNQSGQVKLTRTDHLYMNGAVTVTVGASAVTPLVQAAADASGRNALYCSLTPQAGFGSGTTDQSRLVYTHEDTDTERYIGFFAYCGVPVALDNRAIDLYTLPSGFTLRRNNGVTEVAIVGGATHASATHIARDTLTRVMLYWKRSTGASDGEIKLWIDPTASTDPPDIDQTHNNTKIPNSVRLPVLANIGVGEAMASDVFNEFARYRFGPTWDDAFWMDNELTVCTAHSLSDPATIDVRLRCQFEPQMHGTPSGGTVDIQWQYRKGTSGGWTTSATDAAVADDGNGQWFAFRTIAALDEKSTYQFRCNVVDGGSITYTTSIASCFTPSATSGTPTTLRFTTGSCIGSIDQAPLHSIATIADDPPHAAFSTGDTPDYFDDAVGAGDVIPAVTALAADYRNRWRISLDDGDMNRLARSGPFLHAVSNHNVDGKRFGAGAQGPSAPFLAAANDASDDFYKDGRLRTLPAASIPNSHGTWWETARCLIVFMDTWVERNADAGDETYWGADQLAEIITLLSTTTKPMVFLIGDTLFGDTDSFDDRGLDGKAHSFVEHHRERRKIEGAFYGNTKIRSKRLLCWISGDMHSCGFWTSASHDRTVKEVTCSPYARSYQPALLDIAVNRSPQHAETPEPLTGDIIYQHLHLTGAEQTLSVRADFINGRDGSTAYSETWRAAAAEQTMPTRIYEQHIGNLTDGQAMGSGTPFTSAAFDVPAGGLLLIPMGHQDTGLLADWVLTASETYYGDATRLLTIHAASEITVSTDQGARFLYWFNDTGSDVLAQTVKITPVGANITRGGLSILVYTGVDPDDLFNTFDTTTSGAAATIQNDVTTTKDNCIAVQVATIRNDGNGAGTDVFSSVSDTQLHEVIDPTILGVVIQEKEVAAAGAVTLTATVVIADANMAAATIVLNAAPAVSDGIGTSSRKALLLLED